MKIKDIITEITTDKYTRLYQIKKSNHERLTEIFDDALFESELGNEEKRTDVLNKIKNGDYEKQNSNNFQKALKKSKHPYMLHMYSISEFNKMKLFKLSGYDIGFALKKWSDGTYSEIVSVFNNEPDIKTIGKELLKSAIKLGGRYLDHFDGFLSGLYSSLGFKEYNREKFDPKYDTDGSFRNKYGTSDIVYRVYKK